MNRLLTCYTGRTGTEESSMTEMKGTPGPCMQLAATTNSDLETNPKPQVINSDLETIQKPEGINYDLETDPKPQVIYRCKKCRRIVATQEMIVPHERGQGEMCFKWRKRSTDLTEKELSECSSIFVEPMKWMQTLPEGDVEKTLQCMGCNAKLGSFCWFGMQCNCGAWVTPAFQLHKSRLDECQT